MKKYLLLLILPLMSVVSSCQKTTIYPNRSVIVDLRPGNWVPSNGGRSYTAAIDLPELDNYLNERGGVLVNISFGDQTYESIPQVYDGVSYSYITRPGQLVLELQASDGVSVINPPGGMTVKIVLLETE